jgi:hypothetical protein
MQPKQQPQQCTPAAAAMIALASLYRSITRLIFIAMMMLATSTVVKNA